MKARLSRVFVLIVIVGMGTFMSCGEDGPSVSKESEVRAKLISAQWKIDEVEVDGSDQSDVYADLKLTFTSTGYTSINGGVIWPASGTWTFTTKEANSITRNDGLQIEIEEITDTMLKLALSWDETTIGPGRVRSVSGQHVFTFNK